MYVCIYIIVIKEENSDLKWIIIIIDLYFLFELSIDFFYNYHLFLFVLLF